MEVTKLLRDKVNYTVALISEFAAAHSLNTSQAYRYLDRFGGMAFIERFYDVNHTLSFDQVVADLTEYCSRKGGQLA